ncbi:MAG: hypothetical protein WEB56_13510, partial [Roseovarius sp.]
MMSHDFQAAEGADLPPNKSRADPALRLTHSMSFETSVRAFELASKAGAAFSPEDLIESGTWQKYERRVATLARSHPRGDPFGGYLSRLAVDGWSGRNARQADRSALVRIAARIVMELMPTYWRELLPNMEHGTEREACLDVLRPQLSTSVRRQMQDATRPLSESERGELVSAACFLVHVPPDPFHTTARDSNSTTAPASSRRRQDRSAQKTLTALNRHTRRKQVHVPAYDWRNHFWTAAALKDPHLDLTRRAILATMIATGARPAEFSDDLGIKVSLVSDGGQDRLLFKIQGAKTTKQAHETLPGKGQSSRSLEVECAGPEARWLRYMLLEGDPLRLVISSPAEAANGIPLPVSERHRRVSVSLGKLVTRLGKVAFPKLRHNLTPYVFRHAIGADLKASDQFEPEMIAKILG